jgi:hypothetical protein
LGCPRVKRGGWDGQTKRTLDGDDGVVIGALVDGLEVVEEDHVRVVVGEDVGPGVREPHGPQLPAPGVHLLDEAVLVVGNAGRGEESEP